MPRVLHVVQSGDRGGVQRHVRDLAVGLPDCTAGVVVGAEGWMSGQVRAAGAPVLAARSLRRSLDPWAAVRAAREVAAAAAAVRPTLVHAHGVLALLACRALPRTLPLVYTAHGFQWRDPAQPASVRHGSRLLHRRAASRVQALVAVSRSDAEDAAAVGFPPGRIHLIPNGVPPVGLGRCTRAAERVGVAARLVAGKGLEELLAVLVRLPAARLLVAGTGPREAALRRLARRLGVAPRVRWCGWQDDLRDFYAGLDLYATLSRKEGLPYAVLDAMAHGLPVVASDIPGHAQLVDNGVTGLLVAAGDVEGTARAIGALLSDREARCAMGRAGALAVRERFSLQQMLSRHRELYGAVAAAAAP